MDTGCIADGLSPLLHLSSKDPCVSYPFQSHPAMHKKTEDLVNALFLNAPPNRNSSVFTSRKTSSERC